MIDPLVPLVFSVSLALMFFMAAHHKFKSIPRFRASLDAYGILPQHLLTIAAHVIPLLEMSLVFLLLIPVTRAGAGAASAFLLLVYGMAMATNLFRRRTQIDCGCGDRPQSLSVWLLLRNSLLALGAMLLAVPVLERSLVPVDFMVVGLFTAVLAMFYVTVDELVRNHSAITRQ